MQRTELSDCMGVQNRKYYYILNGQQGEMYQKTSDENAKISLAKYAGV